MFNNLDPQIILVMIVVFLVSIAVHEFAHARSALAAGDDTAQRQGRVSLNPLVHLDPVGTVMFLFMLLGGIGLAWGKPVPVNPLRFRNPRWDNLKVSLWGPMSNLILAVICAALFRMAKSGGVYDYLVPLLIFVRVNIGLAMFNLLPIPPLDGSHILSSLLPIHLAKRLEYTVGRYGMVILLVMILPIFGNHSLIGWIIGVPIDIVTGLLLGTTGA